MKLFVLILASTIFAGAIFCAKNAASRAKTLNDAFMAAYRKSGIDGIQAYLDANFYYQDFVGRRWNRAAYLAQLRAGPKIVQLTWRKNGEQVARVRKSADSAKDLLIVTYYHFHVLYDLTFVEDTSLKGGYRWLKMEPAVA